MTKTIKKTAIATLLILSILALSSIATCFAQSGVQYFGNNYLPSNFTLPLDENNLGASIARTGKGSVFLCTADGKIASITATLAYRSAAGNNIQYQYAIYEVTPKAQYTYNPYENNNAVLLASTKLGTLASTNGNTVVKQLTLQLNSPLTVSADKYYILMAKAYVPGLYLTEGDVTNSAQLNFTAGSCVLVGQIKNLQSQQGFEFKEYSYLPLGDWHTDISVIIGSTQTEPDVFAIYATFSQPSTEQKTLPETNSTMLIIVVIAIAVIMILIFGRNKGRKS